MALVSVVTGSSVQPLDGQNAKQLRRILTWHDAGWRTGQQNQDFESQRAGQARVVEALQWSLPALYELPGLKQEDRKRRVAQGMLAALQGWDWMDGMGQDGMRWRRTDGPEEG